MISKTRLDLPSKQQAECCCDVPQQIKKLWDHLKDQLSLPRFGSFGFVDDQGQPSNIPTIPDLPYAAAAFISDGGNVVNASDRRLETIVYRIYAYTGSSSESVRVAEAFRGSIGLMYGAPVYCNGKITRAKPTAISTNRISDCNYVASFAVNFRIKTRKVSSQNASDQPLACRP